MLGIIIALLVAVFIIEARNHRGLEDYHNWLKDAADVEAVRPRGSWYNPAIKPKRWDVLALFRDPWHRWNLIMWVLVIVVMCLAAFTPAFPHWYCLAGTVVLLRAVVFPVALKVFRKLR